MTCTACRKRPRWGAGIYCSQCYDRIIRKTELNHPLRLRRMKAARLDTRGKE